MSSPHGYAVDPTDPRAPSMELWDAMTASERKAVVDALPSDIESTSPPEGDPHRIPKQRALEALDAFFKRKGRQIYLSNELPVYYPGEGMFAPDVIAVLDVDPKERLRWVVADEGKGLDFVLEVTFHGSRQKDLALNVGRYAALGIPEYFVFDRMQQRIYGWRLAGSAHYEAIVPQFGRWKSEVLDLELAVESARVRFYTGTAVVPELAELVTRANAIVDNLQDRVAMAEARAEEEKLRAEEEKARAEEEKLRAEEEKARAEEEKLRAEEEKA
ncbi:MAG TPA: Uma2 family endonuclease, partial [Polyangiaceae bacterium]